MEKQSKRGLFVKRTWVSIQRSTEYEESEEEDDDRIQFDDVKVDDELWGDIRRYVELGAVVL
jgi:hypothetical protein